MEEARLRWQCRRGMRELDQLLTHYLERRYPLAAEQEKSAFHTLLALPDPELIGYLLQREVPREASLKDVVNRIREQTDR